MIRRILTYYVSRLDEYLQNRYHQPEGMAEVGNIGSNADEKPCKMIVSLLSIERETAGGIASTVEKRPSGFVRLSPPLLMNLNLMFAAIYDEKRYAESLSVLSDTLKYIQSTSSFEFEGQGYTIEMVTLLAQDINNIWTTMGGQYYPSVVCKLRRLAIDTGEITGTGKAMKQPDFKL